MFINWDTTFHLYFGIDFSDHLVFAVFVPHLPRRRRLHPLGQAWGRWKCPERTKVDSSSGETPGGTGNTSFASRMCLYITYSFFPFFCILILTFSFREQVLMVDYSVPLTDSEDDEVVDLTSFVDAVLSSSYHRSLQEIEEVSPNPTPASSPDTSTGEPLLKACPLVTLLVHD